MRGLKYATLSLAVLGLTATVAFSAEWFLYFENQADFA